MVMEFTYQSLPKQGDNSWPPMGAQEFFLLGARSGLITVENIQKTVADYYKVRVGDLLSKRRSRSVARPRQVAMALAKELTTHSLPEIGDAFGGRDHTTVLHACRRVKELRESERRIGEDYMNLLRTLAG